MPLYIDIEDHQFSLFERFPDRFERCAVIVAVHLCIFEKIACFDVLFECLFADKKVLSSMHLSLPWRTGGRRDGEVVLPYLLRCRLNDRTLSGAARTGEYQNRTSFAFSCHLFFILKTYLDRYFRSLEQFFDLFGFHIFYRRKQCLFKCINILFALFSFFLLHFCTFLSFFLLFSK